MGEAQAVGISVRDVVKTFGQVTALGGVSLDIQPGEFFFLLGPSGCGKTTLLRILAGLETPDAGRVLCDGRDVADLPPHRRGMPLVFQNYALWPHLSIFENVAFGLVEQKVPKKDIRRRVDVALEQVDLGDCAARRPGQLSGGQQQRVALARAIVQERGVILLDEPLSNLDAKLRQEMRAQLRRLHREHGMTFLYVTHDQSEALSMADRMAVMDAGHIRAVGTPAELYHRPVDRFCAGFLGEAHFVPGRVAALGAPYGEVDTAFGRWQVVLPAGNAVQPGIAVDVMVRPEALRPMDAGQGGNVFHGEVTEMRIQGATVAVDVRAEVMSVTALVRNRMDLPLHVGATGLWGVDPADSIAILAEGGAS